MMRNFLPTVIVLVVFSGLFFYYYKNETGEVVKEETILLKDKDKFESVTIKNAKTAKAPIGFKKTKEKDKTEWKIVEPRPVDIDSSRFDQVIEKLSHLEAKHAVEDDAKDLAKFGLDKPKTTVEFTWDGKPMSLLIGQKNPVEASDYVKLGDSNRVFLVETYNLSTFEDDLNAFRDKQICHADTDAIAQVKITSPLETRLFKRDAKDKDKWIIDQPIHVQGDAGQIRSLATAIGSLRVDEFVEDGAKDLAKYGLDKPTQTIQLVLDKDGGTKTLLLGAKKKDDQTKIYAKREEQDTVVTISATSIADLSKPVEDYRDKKVFAFDSTKVKSLSLSTNQQTTNLQRDKQGNWKFTQAYVRKDPHTATDVLLKALEALRAKTWTSEEPPVAAHKLAPPVYVVTLSGDGIAPIRLNIGPQTDKGRYYQVDGDKMSFNPEDDLYSKIDAVIAIHHGLFEMDPDKVESITVKHLGFEMTAKRDAKNVFQPEKVRPGVTAVHQKCLTLLEGLRTLAADRFEPLSTAKLGALGLSNPDAYVSFSLKGGATMELSLAADQGGLRAAKVSGLDAIAYVRGTPLIAQIDPLEVPGPAAPPPGSPVTHASPSAGMHPGTALGGITPVTPVISPTGAHVTPPLFTPGPGQPHPAPSVQGNLLPGPGSPGGLPGPGMTLTLPSAVAPGPSPAPSPKGKK